MNRNHSIRLAQLLIFMAFLPFLQASLPKKKSDAARVYYKGEGYIQKWGLFFGTTYKYSQFTMPYRKTFENVFLGGVAIDEEGVEYKLKNVIEKLEFFTNKGDYRTYPEIRAEKGIFMLIETTKTKKNLVIRTRYPFDPEKGIKDYRFTLAFGRS